MCNCGSKKKKTDAKWNHTAPNGVVKVYSTESEARTAAARLGGTAKPA